MEIIGEQEESSATKDAPTPPPAPEEPIQGIRIYTSSVPVPVSGGGNGPRSARSFSHGAHFSPEPGAGLQRASSSSSAQMRRRFSSGIHMTRSSTTGSGARGGGGMVLPHLERGVGNPLFVSSFATLSAGPTLAAKCVPPSPRPFPPVTRWADEVQQPGAALLAVAARRRARALEARARRRRLRVRDQRDERERARFRVNDAVLSMYSTKTLLTPLSVYLPEMPNVQPPSLSHDMQKTRCPAPGPQSRMRGSSHNRSGHGRQRPRPISRPSDERTRPAYGVHRVTALLPN